MTTVSRLVAMLLTLALTALVVAMAIAGLPAARILIITVIGVLAMVIIGGQMGGRSTPRRQAMPIGTLLEPPRPEQSAEAAPGSAEPVPGNGAEEGREVAGEEPGP
ncbi:MAG: hypothetical protein ACYDD4_07660 [Acidimicrobiales bacterium]